MVTRLLKAVDKQLDAFKKSSANKGFPLTQENKTIYFVRDNGPVSTLTYAVKLFRAFQQLHKVLAAV